MTQRDLARAAGMPQPSVARIERGSVIPRTATLIGLLAATGHRLAVEPIAPSAHREGATIPPESIAANVAAWSAMNAKYTDAQAERAWGPQDLTWGVFSVREDAIGEPLGNVDGMDVVELGCGTAYFSAQLARRGARPVGVDPTLAQLATARRMMERTGITFPLVEAPGERVPLADASFDLAFSEFGASLWADPVLWLPEAARLLRPGGRLVFLTNSFISYLCAIDEGGTSETLQRPQFGPSTIQWPGEQGIEYHLAHGQWIDLLREAGFAVERLIELQAPADATVHEYYDEITPEWASKWPHEEIWVARLRG